MKLRELIQLLESYSSIQHNDQSEVLIWSSGQYVPVAQVTSGATGTIYIQGEAAHTKRAKPLLVKFP